MHFSFDEQIAFDKSGNRNTLYPPPGVGPEDGGKGYSAYFDSNTMSVIPHNDIFD